MKLNRKNLKKMILQEMADYENVNYPTSYVGIGNRPVSNAPGLNSEQEIYAIETLEMLLEVLKGAGRSGRKPSKAALLASLRGLLSYLEV